MPALKKSIITAGEAFSKMPNSELIPFGKFLVQNLRDHPEYFPNPTIPLDQAEADIDDLQRLTGATLFLTQMRHQMENLLTPA